MYRPLLQQVAGMSPDQSEKMNRIVDSLMAYHPEKIILFGSAARGDTDEYSDIDLIVIKKTEQRFVQRLIDIASYFPGDLNVDALVYTPEEFQTMLESGNPFMEKALADGRVLYEKS